MCLHSGKGSPLHLPVLLCHPAVVGLCEALMPVLPSHLEFSCLDTFHVSTNPSENNVVGSASAACPCSDDQLSPAVVDLLCQWVLGAVPNSTPNPNATGNPNTNPNSNPNASAKHCFS